MDVTDLDYTTEKAIDDRLRSSMEMANTKPEDYGQEVIDRNKSNPFAQQNLMNAAISKKAMKSYQTDLHRMKEMRELNLTRDIFKDLENSASLQQKRHQFARVREMAVKQRIMDARAQRAQTLSSILGIGFALGGAALGAAGGPAGAVAGAAIGNQVGQTVGGGSK